MSIGKELRERFSPAKDTPDPVVPATSVSKELRERFSPVDTSKATATANEALGIMSEDLELVVVGDIVAMIKGNLRPTLEGYIFCLSRIMSHAKGWEYINKAFSECNEKVPERYRQRFGQNLPDKIVKKGMTVT